MAKKRDGFFTHPPFSPKFHKILLKMQEKQKKGGRELYQLTPQL
jgi:hypothetical protein